MSEQKKSLPVLLIASLCINGALLGLAGGMWIATTRHDDLSGREMRRMNGPGGGGMSGPFEERIARMAVENLGDDERREFRQNLSREWRETRGKRDAIDQARTEVMEVLGANELDEAAAKAAFAKLRDAEMGIRTQLHSGLIGLMKDLPVEKRQEILKRSQERFGHRGDKRGDHHEGREDRRGGPDSRRFEDMPPPPDDLLPSDESETPEPDQQ